MVTSGSGTWHRSGAEGVCGAVLTADGSTIPGGGDFSIALRVTSLRLRSTNCSESFVAVHLWNASGPLLRRFCFADSDKIESGVLEVIFAKGSRLVFVALTATSINDSVSVEFASVASTCPREAGMNGPESMCSGRGECVDVDMSSIRNLPTTEKTCSCRWPWAASSLTSTCDQCAWGLNQWTFPNCSAPPLCPWNCNGRGHCDSLLGCVCDAPYYGRLCELARSTSHMQASSRLQMRLSLDDGSGALSTESSTGPMLSCQLSGCKLASRSVGVNFREGQNESGLHASLTADPRSALGGASATRRHFTVAEAATSIASQDTGIELNRVRIAGTPGDYWAQGGVSGTSLDVAGQSTFTTWVRLSRSSSGFVFAKTDAVWYADGTNPLLEKAYFDVQDRHAPLSSMRLRDTNASV